MELRKIACQYISVRLITLMHRYTNIDLVLNANVLVRIYNKLIYFY